MTKTEFVKALKVKTGFSTLAQAEAAYAPPFAIIRATLKTGEFDAITGFGSFKVVERNARNGRNPRTGEKIQIPAQKAVKFSTDKTLKESL